MMRVPVKLYKLHPLVLASAQKDRELNETYCLKVNFSYTTRNQEKKVFGGMGAGRGVVVKADLPKS